MTLYSRHHSRVPFNRPVLFEDGGGVYKGKLANLSCRGVLLEDLSHLPRSETIPLLFEFSLPPECHQDWIYSENIKKKIVRVHLHILRKETGQNFRCAGEFLSLSIELRQMITLYVERFNDHLLFLLKRLGKGEIRPDLLKRASLLGIVPSSEETLQSELQKIYAGM